MIAADRAFAAHFARVLPIVGADLGRMRVAVAGLNWIAPLVDYLAASGIRRWLWRSDGADTGALARRLEQRHGAALALRAEVAERSEWPLAAARQPCDLVLAAGGASTLLAAVAAADAARCPALLIIPPVAGEPCRARWVLPADDRAAAPEWIGRYARAAMIRTPPAAMFAWDWITSAPLLAGFGRALLLRDTPFARADLAELWACGIRELAIGGEHPFDIRFGEGKVASETSVLSVAQRVRFHTPRARRGSLLIAGLGSIGSVAAAYLAPLLDRAILADPDLVDEANPARQAYDRGDIGAPKPIALARHLRGSGVPSIIALAQALTDEADIAALHARYGITVAIVATGAHADFAIARGLRAAGIPHVVARCYPRARFWEAIMIDGAHGPAYEAIRGHLTPGPAAPPTPEQRRAYSAAGALEAEPATLIESGWAAAWVARLAAQLLAPAGLRERWMLELLGARRVCLVGGVGVEPTPIGPAYGVAMPGQIHAWGRANVIP